MAYGVYLPGRWRRQPQGAVEIDWSHPMARGLLSLARLDGPETSRDYVRRSALQSVGGVLQGVGPLGPAAQFPGAGARYFSLSTASLPSAYTLGAVVQSSSTAGNIIDDDVDTSPRIHQFRLNGSNLEFITFSGAAFSVTSMAWPRRASGSAVAASASGTSAIIAADGVTNSATVGSVNALTSTQWVGAHKAAGSPQPWNGLIWLAAVWARAMTQGELAEWTRNPHQLLRPLRPILYSLPGAAAPTLSLPTVVDITSTSAKPRVTVTF